MHALLLRWDISGQDERVLWELRRLVSNEAREPHRVNGLVSKIWLTRAQPLELAAFYVWETAAALENELRQLRRVREITGAEPTVTRWIIEGARAPAWPVAIEPKPEAAETPAGLRSVPRG